MAQITYADKTALYQNADVAAENKVRDVDMNEIKQVVNDNETKILLDVTDTAPAECSTGDMYFDTTDNLIYTATATDTWGTTGVAPTENTIYVVIDTQTSYIYNGVTLVSVGGGAGGIVVAPDIPTEDTQLYIESTDLDGQYLPVEEDIYSTTETKTNKVWIDGKPIYRKVLVDTYSTAGSSAFTKSIDVGSSIDTMISYDGIYYETGGSLINCINKLGTMTTSGANYQSSFYYHKGSNVIVISMGGKSSAQTVQFVVTVEYTKTS